MYWQNYSNIEGYEDNNKDYQVFDFAPLTWLYLYITTFPGLRERLPGFLRFRGSSRFVC